jgi:2-amino-4-hydroxy-6-hydroxymethyldihydropteridine diphosphokinase
VAVIGKRQNRALIALGANLPGPGGHAPLETCRWAAARLDALPGLRLRALSRWYRTAPVDSPPGAPAFVNAVAWLEGEAGDPAALLAALHGLEAEAGRERPFPNAPRPLDLDLIDLDGLVRAAPDPVLPHPRAHLRRFVLDPLAEVAPFWVHPLLGLRASALAAGLAGEAAPEPLAG